jgi:hypothetical protein
LLQLLRALEASGIPSIPFKGPVLSERLYGDAALRQSSDLDLIVRPEDLPQALATLQSLGFEREYAISPERIPALMANSFEIALTRDGIHVDLHWDVMPRFYGIPFDLHAAWLRSRRVDAAGTQVLEFSPEDHFLALALHSSKHFWAKLIWLSDLRQLIFLNPALDWDLLLERARMMRVENILTITLALLRDVLGVEPNAPAILERLSPEQDCHWRAAYEMARRNLCSPHPEIEGLRTYRFFLRARDTRSDAVRQVFRHAFTPSSSELFKSERSIPAHMHLPVHLWRLVTKFLSFLWNSL